MSFVVTFCFLLVGSALMTFGVPSRWRPYREHAGMILLIYGFVHFLGYFGDFFRTVRDEPAFSLAKMGMWVMTMVIGFVLAYPLLQEHLFRRAGGLEEQGRVVFQGFDGVRVILGLAGFGVAGVMLLLQLGIL